MLSDSLPLLPLPAPPSGSTNHMERALNHYSGGEDGAERRDKEPLINVRREAGGTRVEIRAQLGHQHLGRLREKGFERVGKTQGVGKHGLEGFAEQTKKGVLMTSGCGGYCTTPKPHPTVPVRHPRPCRRPRHHP